MVRIIGNFHQQKRTIQAVESSIVMVLSGPRHVGKRTFLKSVVYERYDHADVMLAGGSVKDAREVSQFLRQMPLAQGRRVVVVDCYDGISEAAQDAYLKPCEQMSPDGLIVFVITDESHFLHPLLSRITTVIRWGALSLENMEKYAASIGGADSSMIHVCEGLPGLCDTLAQMNVEEICDYVMDDRSFVRPTPSDVKSMPSGRSYARDALCSILKACATQMVAKDRILRARKALRLASILERIPSVNVDIHWRHEWDVLGVT